MGLFGNEGDRVRKENLRALEDKRLAFVERVKALGAHADHALYGQVGGGFHGVVLSGKDILYVTGPGPGEEEDFTVAKHPSVIVRTEEISIKSEGMGGILGMGKRGAQGFKLGLTFPDGTEGDVEIVSGLNCIYEQHGANDPLFDARRRRGNANVVWEYTPVESARVAAIVEKWLKLLGGAMK